MSIVKNNITVFIHVFNEEHRIDACLKSFSWADEIILFDKHSTDRTREIAEKYTTKVILVPYCDGSENVTNNISQHASSEWCLFPTASSLMHPRLADEIVKLTADKDFDFDVIGMPYGMYSLGVRSSHSPFYDKRKYTLIRRSKLRLSTQLHKEISFDSTKIFDMPIIDDDAVLYHCTHKDLEAFFGQTMRYTKYESLHDQDLTCKRAFQEILKAIINSFIRRRSLMLGWDGVALSLMYVTYFVIKFLCVWDRNREDGNVVYPELRDKIDRLWTQKNQD